MLKNRFFPFLVCLLISVVALMPASKAALGDTTIAGSQPSSWAVETVNKAKNNKLITPKTAQGYQGDITREEFCELVMKLYEATYIQPAEPASPNPFNDTANLDVLKAYNLKIVGGYGGGRFAPDEKITREQLACMFNNYLNLGFEYQGELPELDFADGNTVTDWAQKSVKIMVDLGILGSVGNKMLAPQGYATREQAIVLVVRVYDMVQEAKGALQSEGSENNPPEQKQEGGLEQRSKEEITKKWKYLNIDYSSKPFAEPPSISAPYSTGKVTEGYLQDTVKLANFIRYLAGLPADLISDEDLNNKAQHAAVLEAAVGYEGHYPHQPADMGDDFYSIAAAAARTCNLSMEADSAQGYQRLLSAVNNWMYDGTSERNTSEVAHRRWVLYAPIKKVGFGYAQGPHDYGKAHIATMYTQDKSRSSKVDYDYIAWPVPGYMPNLFFLAFASYPYQTPYPWSVFINPDKYQAPDKNSVTVAVTRKRDQKKWMLDKNDIKPYDQFTEGQEYFNVKNISYGVKNIIVFSNGLRQFSDGEEYEVCITGLKSKSGESAQISYTSKFFEIE